MGGIATHRMGCFNQSAGGGAAAAYGFAESAGPTTNTTGSWTDLATLSFAFEASTNYICFFSTEAANSSSSATTSAQLTFDGVSQHATPLQNDVRNASEYRSAAGVVIIQNGTAGTKDIKVQGRRDGSGTATFRNSKISIFKMGANDEFAEDLAGDTLTDTTANKTATTVASLTFTPPSTGDYLYVLAFLPRLDNGSNVYFGFELTDGTNTTGEIGLRPEGGSQEPLIAFLPAPSLSGSKTLSLKIRQTGTGAATIGAYETRLLAIRLDRFAGSHVSALGSDSSSTTTSYVTAHSQTFTPAAADHFTAASWFQRVDGANEIHVVGQLLDGAASEGEIETRQFYEPAGTGFRPGFAQTIEAYSAASRTQAIQRKSASGASRVRASSCLVSFDLSGL